MNNGRRERIGYGRANEGVSFVATVHFELLIDYNSLLGMKKLAAVKIPG